MNVKRIEMDFYCTNVKIERENICDCTEHRQWIGIQWMPNNYKWTETNPTEYWQAKSKHWQFVFIVSFVVDERIQVFLEELPKQFFKPKSLNVYECKHNLCCCKRFTVNEIENFEHKNWGWMKIVEGTNYNTKWMKRKNVDLVFGNY